MTAALDRAVANALGLKSVHNCERWSRTMIEEDDDIQVYKKPWVGLTDEEAMKTWERIIKYAPGEMRVKDFARAIEQMLKEKNNAL